MVGVAALLHGGDGGHGHLKGSLMVALAIKHIREDVGGTVVGLMVHGLLDVAVEGLAEPAHGLGAVALHQADCAAPVAQLHIGQRALGLKAVDEGRQSLDIIAVLMLLQGLLNVGQLRCMSPATRAGCHR